MAKVQRNRFPIFLIKLLVACFSLWIIYRSVIYKHNFQEIISFFSNIFQQQSAKKWIGIVFVLMIFNWFLETVKWRIIVSKIQQVNFVEALMSVLMGITVSFFTPYRTGEFAGRVVNLDSRFRVKAALASLVGSFNQLMITLVAGIAGAQFILYTYFPHLEKYRFIILILSFLLCVCIIFLYFKIRLLSETRLFIPLLGNFKRYLVVFHEYHTEDLIRLTFLSIGRFIIFSIQYFILLKISGVPVPFIKGICIIAVIYLVMAVVPGFAITEVTFRGSIALFFLSVYTDNALTVFAASFGIWFINIVIPAAFGSLSFLYSRIRQ